MLKPPKLGDVMYPKVYQIKGETTSKSKLYQLSNVLAKHKNEIKRLRDTKHEKSKKIELLIKPDLKKYGYLHSVTNKDLGIFKNNSLFEVDFYNPTTKTAIEIEKSNLYTKVWLALYKQLESPIIDHGIIMVPQEKHTKTKKENTFELTYKRVENNTQYLLFHLKSLTIIGY
ncbi:hypothetical protein PRVXT_001381 [Proteinivorax tanatarense]|uniref:Uncharacterized protein n=1 Tax=Proteinivorax tanatarense TaxID=1260629 RepID=A0AAU7VQ57_9FIRM